MKIKYDENKTTANKLKGNQNFGVSSHNRQNRVNMRSQSQYKVNVADERFQNSGNFKRTTTIDPSSEHKKVEILQAEEAPG